MHDVTPGGAADRRTISIREAWEIDCWTMELAVSRSELERIMKKVGNSAAEVRRELGQPIPTSLKPLETRSRPPACSSRSSAAVN
jgi:hypothetical protein